MKKRWGAGLAAAVATLTFVVFQLFTGMPKVFAAGALCYDGGSGVTQLCPDTTDFLVDGKQIPTGTNPFADGKCYEILDVGKGWVTTPCSQAVFTNVVQVAKPSSVNDGAYSGKCPTNVDPTGKCNVYTSYINPIVNGLAAIVVLAVVISIIIGGIQYSTSAGDPGAAAKARKRITNAILAFVLFLFLWSFLQWLTPGGLLNGL